MNDLSLSKSIRDLVAALADQTGRGLLRWERQPETYTAVVGAHRIEIVANGTGVYEFIVSDLDGHVIDRAVIDATAESVRSEQFEQITTIRHSASTRREHTYGDISEHLKGLGAPDA